MGVSIGDFGLNRKVWTGCHLCGTCSGKKVKCKRIGGFELHILTVKGVFNVFKGGVVVLSGRITDMKKILDETDFSKI